MWNDYVASSDYLFYKPYASIIARAAMDRTRSPMTIGVFGTWGTGKSTLLAMVKDEIENRAKDKGSICIRLNAWTFEGYDDAKTALMEALIENLEDKKPFLPFREKIRSIIGHLDLMKISSIAVSAGLPLALRLLMGATGGTFVSVNTKNPADTLTEALPKISSEISQAAGANSTMQSIRKFREEMESLLQGAEVENIVVLLDDLDRCMPDAIMDMLEAIRLFLTIPKLTFVVAADDAIIKYAVNRKYPDKDKLNLNLADEYVEKMFHYPIYIPGLSNKDIENHLLLLAARKHLDDDSYGRIISEFHEKGRILDKNRIEDTKLNPAPSGDYYSKKSALGAASVQSYYNKRMTALGVDSSTMNSKVKSQEDIVEQVTQWRTSVAGVNWDEELTNMIMFQQGYAACSRCLTTMDEMLDRLINSSNIESFIYPDVEQDSMKASGLAPMADFMTSYCFRP